jgi:hypothetical protein
MNDHWVISAITEYAHFQKCPAFRRSIIMIRSSSISTRLIALRAACCISASVIPWLRAGSPTRA